MLSFFSPISLVWPLKKSPAISCTVLFFNDKGFVMTGEKSPPGKSQTGQTTIEYLLLTIVILGIVIAMAQPIIDGITLSTHSVTNSVNEPMSGI